MNTYSNVKFFRMYNYSSNTRKRATFMNNYTKITYKGKKQEKTGKGKCININFHFPKKYSQK